MRARTYFLIHVVCGAWLALLGASAVAQAPGESPNPEPLTQAEADWLGEQPYIRVGIDAGAWPPIDIPGSDGTYYGMSADYLKLLEARLGVRFRVRILPDFEAVLKAAEKGEIDVVPSAARTPDRERYLAFTEPYLSNVTVMVTRRDTPPLPPESDMAGLTLAQERGYAATEQVRREYPRARVQPHASTLSALRAVSERQADLYIGDLLPVLYLMDRHLIANLEVRGSVRFGVSDLRFAVPKQLSLLASALQKGLNAIGEHEHAAIRARWVSVRATGDRPIALELSREERAWLADHPVLRVAYDQAFAPFSARDPDGTMSGLAADYLRLVSERLKVAIEAKPVHFGSGLRAFREREHDVFAALAVTAERRRYTRFAGPYVSMPTAIVGRVDGPFIAGLAGLRGQAVALPESYFLRNRLADEFPGIRLIDCERTVECLAKVQAGEAAATFANLAVVSPLLQGQYAGRLKVAAFIDDSPSELHFGIRADWPELQRLFNKALASISAEEHDRIRQRWLTARYREGIEWREVLRYVLPVGAALLALVVFVFYWNRQLANEVRERTRAERALTAAKDEAQAATRAKSQFLAMMGHEIRTPMNGVIGMLDVLSHSRLDADQLGLLRTAHASAESLLTLLSDLLDFSKIEAGKLTLNPESCEIRPLIEAALNIFAHAAFEKNLKLRLAIAPQVAERHLLDGVRLRQVLANLLSNAIKFTREGEVTVTLDASLADAGRQMLTLTVEDTGIGIAPEDQAHVFDAFAQADASISSRYGGTGLGLAICKRLLELMEGTLTLKSNVNEGSVLCARFPAPIREGGATPPHWPGVRALLLVQDAVLAQTLRDSLAAAGIEAREPRTWPYGLAGIFGEASSAQANVVIAEEEALRDQMAVLAPQVKEGQLPPDPRVLLLQAAPSIGVATGASGVLVLSASPLQPTALRRALQLALEGDSGEGAPGRPLETALRVLVADDHPTNRLVVRRQLELLGHHVDEAPDGAAALALWRLNRHPVVLTDFHMPHLGGPELAEAIHATDPTVIVIGLTAEGQADRAPHTALHAVLHKPLTRERLAAALRGMPQTRSQDTAEASQTPPVTATEEVLHLPTLLATFGEPAAVADVLRDFCRALDEDAHALSHALAQGEGAELARVAHRIKGAARTIAAHRLAAAIAGLEIAGRRADHATFAARHAHFEAERQALRAAIAAFIGNPDGC
jgi:two-component system sensor histidine kinase EvgS